MSELRLAAVIEERFSQAVLSSHAFRGDETVVLKREALVEVARFLRDDEAMRMNFLMDLSVVDYSAFGKGPKPAFFASSGVSVRPNPNLPDEDPWPGPPDQARFAVVYHFFSTTHKHRLRLTVPVQEGDEAVDSLTGLWPGANWLEREAWDMFGIQFNGHPDLRRILMYDEFDGHPLRKDYPINARQPLIGPKN